MMVTVFDTILRQFSEGGAPWERQASPTAAAASAWHHRLGARALLHARQPTTQVRCALQDGFAFRCRCQVSQDGQHVQIRETDVRAAKELRRAEQTLDLAHEQSGG